MNEHALQISYQYEIPGITQESFAVMDLREFLEMNNLDKDQAILNITSVFVPKCLRQQGFAKDMIKRVTDAHQDVLIMLVAGASKLEYETEPTYEEYEELFQTLDKVYSSCGFVNVNDTIGQYERKSVYIFRNSIGEKVLYALNKNKANS